jgi:hypothetical protein
MNKWNVLFKRIQFFFQYLTVRRSVVGTATWMRAGRSGVRIQIGQEMFSSPKRLWRLWDLPTLVFIQGPEREVNHSLASSALSRITGAAPQLPHAPSRMNVGNVTFTFEYLTKCDRIYFNQCLVILFLWRVRPTWVMVSSFLWFVDHTRRTTVLLWTSDQPKEETYTWQHNTHNRQISMPPVGFEPSIPAS